MDDTGMINDALNHINHYVGINEDNVAFINQKYIETWNKNNSPYKLVIEGLVSSTNEGMKYTYSINGLSWGKSIYNGFKSIVLFNNDNFIAKFNIVDDVVEGIKKKKFTKSGEGGANKKSKNAKSKRRTKRSKRTKRKHSRK